MAIPLSATGVFNPEIGSVVGAIPVSFTSVQAVLFLSVSNAVGLSKTGRSSVKDPMGL